MRKLATHENGEYELFVDDKQATVHAALFHPRHHTIKFTEGELVYQAGITAEILASVYDEGTHEYTDVTRIFESRYGDQYTFHGEEKHNKQWFHKADFWQYEFDSSDNLYHYIRYSTTHHNDDMVIEPHVADDVDYPFPENNVLAFFEPTEQRVRVFAAENNDDDPTPAVDVAHSVFCPRLYVYMSVTDDDGETPMVISLLATPMNESETDDSTSHSLSYISGTHIGSVRKISLDSETQSIRTKAADDYELSGDLWDIICAISYGEQPWKFSSVVPRKLETFTPYHFFLPK